MLLIGLFTTLATLVQAPESSHELRLPFNEGTSQFELRVDPAFFGVRFDHALSENECRQLIDSLPAVSGGEAENATLIPGKTVYLHTINGLSAAGALAACEEIRQLEGVLSASPRLWLEEDPRYLTEEILVRWRVDAPARAIALEIADLEQTAELAFSENPGSVYRVAHGANPLDISNRIAASGLVEFASPDFQLLRIPYGGTNDPLYPDQWHLESIGQNGALVDADIDVEEAWDTTRGDFNITIAVIDTGVELNHPDLRDHFLQGIDVLDDDNDPQAEDYLFGLITENHSTAVCGVAAGHGNNDIGISGVSQESGIIPIRFLSEWIFNQPTLQDEADAFNFANAAGAAVVNNSWGPSGAAPLPASTKAAIDDICENGRNGLGSVVFFAAGNSSANMANNGYASYPLVIAVSACTDQGILASYSSYGRAVDVCAPSNGGVNGITTTDRLGGIGYSSGDYTDTFGGTSSASPCAAGVMLLLLSANPGLSRHEAFGVLLGNTEKIDTQSGTYNSIGHSDFYGFGRVNAALAVADALRIDSVILSGPATGTPGQTVSLDIDNAPSGGTFTIFYSLALGGGIIDGFHPSDLGGKIKSAGSGLLDHNGHALWTSPVIPGSMSGRTVYVEAYATDANGLGFDSEALALLIQ